MKNSKHVFALGGAALLALAGVAHAEAPATDAALKAEMATLKARIGELEGKQSQQWLDARRTEEVKALVREVLSDADTRASLQGDGLAAGHSDGKFFLASQDGNFRLNVGGQIQVRYIFNHRNNADSVIDPTATPPTHSNQDDNEGGFSIARTKLIFDGYIGSPKITYKIQLAADRNDNSIGAEIVTVGYKVTDKFSVSAGRFKDAFLGESMVDDNKQLAVERSTVDSAFGNGYVEGIQAVWVPVDALKLTAAFHDGAGSGSIGGTNDFQNDSSNYAATVRADLKVTGDWKQQADFSSWNDGTALFIGAAATYQEGEAGDRQTSTSIDDSFKYTVDAMFKSAGFGAYAAFVGAEHRNANNPANPSANVTFENMGAVFQVSYFVIPDKFEPFARYEWLNIDSDAGSPGALNIFSFGANYYIKKHDAKFTLDVVWAAESLTGGSTFGGPSSGAGLLADNPVNEDQVTIRAQFQLCF